MKLAFTTQFEAVQYNRNPRTVREFGEKIDKRNMVFEVRGGEEIIFYAPYQGLLVRLDPTDWLIYDPVLDMFSVVPDIQKQRALEVVQ